MCGEGGGQAEAVKCVTMDLCKAACTAYLCVHVCVCGCVHEVNYVGRCCVGQGCVA